jgi:hypothetical protein
MAELHRPHAPQSGDATSNPEVHHEESDVNIRAILVFGAGLIVVAVLIHLVTYVLFRYFDAREAQRVTPQYPLAIAQEQRVPSEPRLQTDPRQDLADLREKEDETLNSYGWVDRNAGVVRIPIDEAIRLTLARGLPARQAPSR